MGYWNPEKEYYSEIIPLDIDIDVTCTIGRTATASTTNYWCEDYEEAERDADGHVNRYGGECTHLEAGAEREAYEKHYYMPHELLNILAEVAKEKKANGEETIKVGDKVYRWNRIEASSTGWESIEEEYESDY